MKDLKSPVLMWVKAVLFLFIGLGSWALIVMQTGSWKIGMLAGLAIWAFCRAYYFAFYVIEHYVDPNYRFSGLLNFLKYFFRK